MSLVTADIDVAGQPPNRFVLDPRAPSGAGKCVVGFDEADPRQLRPIKESRPRRVAPRVFEELLRGQIVAADDQQHGPGEMSQGFRHLRLKRLIGTVGIHLPPLTPAQRDPYISGERANRVLPVEFSADQFSPEFGRPEARTIVELDLCGSMSDVAAYPRVDEH